MRILISTTFWQQKNRMIFGPPWGRKRQGWSTIPHFYSMIYQKLNLEKYKDHRIWTLEYQPGYTADRNFYNLAVTTWLPSNRFRNRRTKWGRGRTWQWARHRTRREAPSTGSVPWTRPGTRRSRRTRWLPTTIETAEWRFWKRVSHRWRWLPRGWRRRGPWWWRWPRCTKLPRTTSKKIPKTSKVRLHFLQATQFLTCRANFHITVTWPATFEPLIGYTTIEPQIDNFLVTSVNLCFFVIIK